METWIASEAGDPHGSPLRKAGASRKMGTFGAGFRIMLRRIPVVVVVREVVVVVVVVRRRRERDRRPGRGKGEGVLWKAILPFAFR